MRPPSPRSRSITASKLAVIGLLCLAGCGDPTTPGKPSSETADEPPGRFTLEIRAEPDDLTRVTIVVTADDRTAFAALDGEPPEGLISISARKPVLGSLSKVSDSEIHYRPAFPLLPDTNYKVRFDASKASGLGNTRLVKLYFIFGGEPAPPPVSEAVYPTGEVLPANHLKFYLVFSEPMQQGEIWEHFTLLDLDSGKPVPRPFRHTELWSPDGRTLTLWFHPGRVKQGVNLNVEIGPILVEGHRYRLVVSGDWPSARGTPLGKDLGKPFRAGPPDRSQPDLKTWVLECPDPGSRNPLCCRLGESLDWALLHSDLAVVDEAGTRVAGTIATTDHESAWKFTPREPWQAGTYRLAVGRVLEDLAGNSIERLFEVDITRNHPVDKAQKVPQTVYREFTIGR